MNYVRIACYSALAINLCSPALAGRGNALAGGWDGTTTGSFGRVASSPAPASASTVPAASPSGAGLFAGSLFDLGSGTRGGGTTGGAPSPEVNAALSLILVGGTVAFLRRRRAGAAKPQA